MDSPQPAAALEPRRTPRLFTAEDAAKGRARKREIAEARKLARLTAPVREYRPEFPAVQADASKAIVGHILADEIAWRSSLLSLLGDFRSVLLADIHGKLYDTEKVTLPALIREARSLMELELKIVEGTKSLNPDGLKRGQVADLLAREELMRHQLAERGLLDEHGKLVRRTAATTEAGSVPPLEDGQASAATSEGVL